MNHSVLKNILFLVLFSVVGFLIYSNTFEAPFVLDDGGKIEKNTYIRIKEISVKSLTKVAFNKIHSPFRFIPRITFALNYYFHQYRLPGYHITNIVIHIITCILLYYFIKMTLSLPILRSKYNNTDIIAFFAAMVWLVNPLHTQSVTYTVQRINSIAAMFFILSMLLYVLGRIRQNRYIHINSRIRGHAGLYLSGAVVAWLMAIGSKQNAAVLPFFIFLYEWYFFQNLDREWLKRNMKIVLVVAAIFAVTAFIFLGSSPLERLKSIGDFGNHEFTLMERVLTQPRVVIYYLSLLAYPHPSRLNLDYDFPLSYSPLDPVTTLFSIFVIIGFIWLAICLAKKERLLSFCIIWFFGNLLIESSVIPLAIIFEHRTYLPSMLIFLLVIIPGHQYIKLKWAGPIMICLMIVVSSFWTYQRNNIWSDPAKFWGDIVKKSPNKARPHNNLGNVLKKQGFLEEAIKHYVETLQIDPNYEKAHSNMGNALKKLGRMDEAIEHYMEALRIKPSFSSAHNNLGNALAKLGKVDEAIKHYKIAIRLNPNYMEANYGMGNVLLTKRDLEGSVKHYTEALRINPYFAEAHTNLGHVLQAQGNLDKAIKHFKEAVRLKPDLTIAHNKLGNALLKAGNIDASIKCFRKALQINPNYTSAKSSLKKALARQKQR